MSLMRKMVHRLLCAILLLGGVVAESPSLSKDGAYATLLYGEDFLLGVRVLGQSIRETKTDHDLVAIVTGPFSKKSEETLKKDGWVVKQADTIANPGKGPQPGKGYPERFSAVYTKLTIFNLTEYKKGFCATLRHSERLNSGVMVVTPSETVYKEMLEKLETLSSYTGGDQGFLNEYYKGFVNAPLFEPGKIPVDTKMMRLATSYNADIGLYVLNSNRWMFPKEVIKIVHYTLGPFKPWNWWTSWVISDLDAWKSFRNHLPPDAYGNRSGVTNAQRFWTHVLSWVPLMLAALLYYKYFHQSGSHSSNNGKAEAIPSTSTAALTHSLMSQTGLPKRFVGNSILIGYVTLLLPTWLILAMIPKEISTFWGWLLLYEWVIFLHGLLFSLYLKYCHDTGRIAGSSNLPTFKFASWSNPWRVTCKSCGLCVAGMVLCPWISSFFFVSALFGKLAVTVAAVLVLCVLLTHVYSTLPIRWFAYGRNEGSGKTSNY